MSGSSPHNEHAPSPMVSNPLEIRHSPGESRAWRSRLAASSESGGREVAARLRTFSSSPVRRGTTADDNLPIIPLSERDSIFATTYSCSDRELASPALSPTDHDRSPHRHPHDESSTAPIGTASGQSSPPSKPDFTRRSTVSDFLLASTSYESSEHPLERLSHGPRLNDSDVIKRAKNLEKRQHVTRTGSGQPQVAYSLRMSIHDQEGRHRDEELQEQGRIPLASTTNGQAGRKSTARSSSKSRAKQSIEATIATDEPVANARSRKASHYMGLFKENTGSDEKKSHRELHGVLDKSTPPVGQRQRLGPSNGPHSTETDFVGAQAVASSSQDRQPRRQAVAKEPDSTLPKAPCLEGELPLAENVVPESQSSTVRPQPKEKNESIEWRSSTPSGGSLPLRLLEEIRSRPKLGPVNQKGIAENSKPAIGGFSRSKLSPLRLSEIVEKDVGPLNSHGDDDDDVYYDSDKEHISSATYFPHQAPSPSGSEEDNDIEHVPRLVLEDEAHLQPQTISLDAVVEDILPESQRSAQSLQSKATVRSVEQALEADQLALEAKESQPAFYASDSSYSDLDNDSTDDTIPSDREQPPSPFTDRDETTPTATPRAKSSVLSPRMRPPLGAVELKPYKHQVGGHTKVFSFSRQAICKQLNNRENEFYEVIERNHPELLRFLPKYLGVLNVTYQKVSRRKKKFEEAKDLDNTRETDGLGMQEQFRGDSKAGTFEDSTTSRPPPAPRAISHSQHFDLQDDAVPQVVYANNMHMIPTNLFPISPPQPNTARPYSSNRWSIHSPFQDTRSPLGHENSLSPYQSRPTLQPSPSWGATTVNTHFKDIVLREVFSPPVVHHRKRHGYPRHETGHHQRGHSHAQRFAYPEHAEGAPLVRSVTPDITSNREGFRGPYAAPLRPWKRLPEYEEESRTGLVASQASSLDKDPSVKSDSSEASYSDSRVIQRRRSGGGLRRGQVDIDTTKRSEFKYYEEDAVSEETAESTPMKDRSKPKASPSQSSPTGDQAARRTTSYEAMTPLEGKPSNLNRDGALDNPPDQSLTPMNPLQAQQQADKHVRHFLLLEDLTANMSRPCVLDLKMGTRQYGIEATKKKQMSQRAKCRTTTSQQLGVRVCGMQVWSAARKAYTFEDKYAGRDVKPGRDFQNALHRFLYDGVSDASVVRHIPPLLEKISKLERIILGLPGYRFYASSLLMLYDGAHGRSAADAKNKSHRSDQNPGYSSSSSGQMANTQTSDIDIRLVDFANCVTAEDDIPPGATCPPKDPFGIDKGYIRGLRSLRTYLQRIWREIEEGHWVERGEGEGIGLRTKGAGFSKDQPESWQEGHEDPGDVSI